MRWAWLAALLFLGSCTRVPEAPPEALPAGPALGDPVPPVAIAPRPRALTLDAYKRDFAERVREANAEAIADVLPPVLKSIVVLDIAVDARGNLTQLSVRRSNGYRDLERRAVESVRRAVPFPGAGRPVAFLETFLFRDDGRFQIRTLVE